MIINNDYDNTQERLQSHSLAIRIIFIITYKQYYNPFLTIFSRRISITNRERTKIYWIE